MFNSSALLSNPPSLVSVSSACRKGSRELHYIATEVISLRLALALLESTSLLYQISFPFNNDFFAYMNHAFGFQQLNLQMW